MCSHYETALNEFYRRCLRLIYRLFQCPTEGLNNRFMLPTLKNGFKSSVQKRIKNIQQYEHELLDFYLQFKQLKNVFFIHYQENPCIKDLPTGRSSNRLTSLATSAQPTQIHKLISFIVNDDDYILLKKVRCRPRCVCVVFLLSLSLSLSVGNSLKVFTVDLL